MPTTNRSITVEPAGRSVIVDITGGTLYAHEDSAQAVRFPEAITGTKQYWVEDTATYTVTVWTEAGVIVASTTVANGDPHAMVPCNFGLVAARRFPVDSIVHKTADQSSTDGTNLADVTEMSWPIEAGGIYIVEFQLLKSSAATTTGLAVALNGPASPTYLRYTLWSATGSTSLLVSAATTYNTALVSTGVVNTTVPTTDFVNGYVVNGVNAGTLTLRMRTEVDTSAATIQRGSWGRLTRIG
jgi:hypothetical protein